VVVRHLRNTLSKVTEKIETGVIDRSRSFNGNRYKSVSLMTASAAHLTIFLSAAATDDPDVAGK